MPHGLSRFLKLGVALLCAVAGVVHAQQGGDLQARILYAFHTEDTNELSTLIQTLGTQIQSGAGDPALRYHLAHADYRLGLLSDAPHAAVADKAFGGCVEQLREVLKQDVKSAEALVLQSACYANLARYRRIDAVLQRSRAADCLRVAAALAPRNPRVVYLQALDALARTSQDSLGRERAVAQLTLAAELFERSSATSIDVPGWGHADAYLDLGRQLEARGDIIGARNWIEKSLLAAPDYKAARRELTTLVGR